MEEQKLTTEELYGKSDPPKAPTKPLIYEETPIIEPAPTESGPVVPSSVPSKQPKNNGGFLKTVGMVFVYVVLFGVGVWLSTVIGQYAPRDVSQNAPTPTPVQTRVPVISPSQTPDLSAGWKTYEVSGVSYQLPEDVLSPVCDGTGCASQGTYLPGGTRFTVAPRGGNQALRDFRGAVVVDAGGREFTTTEASVSGKPALAFSGLFNGTTAGGYSFTQMRGVMIGVTDTLSLELNHFTPAGVSADFASDDRVFDQVLQTLVLPVGQ